MSSSGVSEASRAMSDTSCISLPGVSASLRLSCVDARETEEESAIFLAGGGIDWRILSGDEGFSEPELPVMSNLLNEFTSKDRRAVLAALSACPSSFRSCSSFRSAAGDSKSRNVLLNGLPGA